MLCIKFPAAQAAHQFRRFPAVAVAPQPGAQGVQLRLGGGLYERWEQLSEEAEG